MTEDSSAPAASGAGDIVRPDDVTLPDGEYAIVEVIGHRTYVGRVSEAERFGTKLLAIEPLFGGQLLPAVMIGGGSIYQFTPCSADVALRKMPTQTWNVPGPVRAIIPAALLTGPDAPSSALLVDIDEDDDRPF